MPIFHYKDSKLIDRVEVRSPHHGIAHATIIAKDNVSADELEKLREQLSGFKFSTLMNSAEGHASIEVRGLKDAKALVTTLDKLDVTNSSVVREETEDDKKKVSFRERVRGKALFLSALFYDLGNAAFIVSGIQRGRHNKGGKFTANDKSEMMIGGAFSVGDVLMTAYGETKGDEELLAAEKGLKRHLHQKGIEVPKGDELNPDSLHQSGAFKATDRWMRHHIVQIKCMSEFAGGLFTIHSALKPGNVNHSKIAAGLLISTGWLATFMLDKPPGHQIFDGTDKPAPSNPAAILADNPRGWIARPLAIGNNVANLWGALNPRTGERSRFQREIVDAQHQLNASHTPENLAHLAYTKTKQHDYAWNVVSACSFLVAHVLFGISGSKRPNETDDDKSMMNDLVLLSANVLSKQPEAVRKTAIEETAEYVAKLAHVRCGKQAVMDAINEKIAELSQSKWATRVHAKQETGQLVGV